MMPITLDPSRFVLPGSILAILFLTVMPSGGNAASAEETGLKIAVEARENQKGYGDLTADLKMILRNKSGAQSQRELSIRTIEVTGDGDRTLFVFDRPRDVKGTAFLIWSHTDSPDEQWLYLPALKRVKRISSSNQSGSFMGSEFSYEDLGTVEVEKFTYQYLRDEPCGNLKCSVSERIPRTRNSGYSRQLTWYDTEAFRLMKVEYFDRKNDLLKTLVLEDYKKYLGEFWRASTLTMNNHLTGKSTVLEWSDYEFRTGLRQRDFTQTALKRAR